jgi:zinc transport system ATP-binding protein
VGAYVAAAAIDVEKTPMISLENVMFGYSDVPGLEDVNLTIANGEFVAVTGPNGASKTTLLKLALGLLKPWEGRIYLARQTEKGEKLRIGYVPQQIASFNAGFPSTVLEFVRSGRFTIGSWLRRLGSKDKEQTEKALRQMGMWELRHRRIGELSGGQKQRICMARALAQEPHLLVLDEPVTGMDAASRMAFYELMQQQVREEGRTVIMVTHNLAELESRLDRIIELVRREDGRWKCCTTTSCSGHFYPAV